MTFLVKFCKTMTFKKIVINIDGWDFQQAGLVVCQQIFTKIGNVNKDALN